LTRRREIAILGGMSSHPPRIVSLFPAATEMVCGIALHSRLVGVSHECNWPPGVEELPRVTRSRIDSAAWSGAIDEQVKALVSAGEPLYEVDQELLISLRPDLIVAQSQCDVCAVSFESVAELTAERPELARSQVLALNPRSLDEVLLDIERIGAAAGAVAAAHALVASLRERIAAVRDSAAAASGRRPRVAVIEWIEPLMIAGNWTPELVKMAGGDYALANSGEASPYVSWSKLVDFAPEVVVVAPCGFNFNRSLREATQLELRPEWAALPAVAHRQVHVVDGDAHFNRPGPRLVDSLELLSRWLREAATA
jgi:iron complex transport system substrate-binding protein